MVGRLSTTGSAPRGLGFGVVGENSLTVLIVGAPSPPPGVRKRWPGNVPREWLTVDRARTKSIASAWVWPLPSLERDDALAETAQELANEILADRHCVRLRSPRRAEGTLLYFKAAIYTKGSGAMR